VIPIHLAARSVGEEVPASGLAGLVRGVFDRAVDAFDADGRMVTLLAPEMYSTPHGILLDRGAQGSLMALGVREGDRVLIREGVLTVWPSPGSPSPRVAIDLRHAARSILRVTRLSIDLSSGGCAQAWAASWAALRGCAPDGTLAGSLGGVSGWAGAADVAYVRRARCALSRLCAAGRSLDGEAAAREVRRLVGVGPGLTPAGDDLLVGFASGLIASAGEGPERELFVRRIARALDSCAGATTLVSAAWLGSAARGRVSEPMLGVAEAIASGVPEAVPATVRTAASVGHSSGSEGVLGLLAGLDTFARPRAVRVGARPGRRAGTRETVA
jgi:hypothetical protein